MDLAKIPTVFINLFYAHDYITCKDVDSDHTNVDEVYSLVLLY